jgi:hypothetical protein
VRDECRRPSSSTGEVFEFVRKLLEVWLVEVDDKGEQVPIHRGGPHWRRVRLALHGNVPRGQATAVTRDGSD